MTDLANYLRRAAETITALLEANRTDHMIPADLQESAENAARGLQTIARHLAAANAEVGRGLYGDH